MPDDLNPSAVADQPGVVSEPGATSATGGGETPGTGEGQGAQPEGKPSSAEIQTLLGPKDLPPELEGARTSLLRDYHSKTQELSRKRKEMEADLANSKSYEQDARTLSDLMQQEWFKKAVEGEKKRRLGQTSVSSLTDEQWQAIKDDRRAFDDLLEQRMTALLESKLGTSVQDLRGSVQKLKEDQEFSSVAKKYEDFDSLNNQGLLGPYFDKGYGPEDAYIHYKWDHGQARGNGKSLEQEVQKALESRKSGSVEKPGPTSIGSASKVIKAKNFNDAFDKVFAAIQSGEKDVRVERE